MAGCRRVADDIHSMFGPREQDVDSVGCPEEATSVLFIASNQRDHYYLGLFSLKVVNGGNAERLEEIGLNNRFPRLCLRSIAGQSGFIQIFLVFLAQYNGKPVAEPVPEAMQLT